MSLFAVVIPGLEEPLAAEARAQGFAGVTVVPGGVEMQGDWPEVWRANICLRGATRILVRVGEFRAMHLAQLDKRARRFDWAGVLRPDVPVRVEAVCRKSRIYHHKGAAQRVARAITEELSAPISTDAALTLKVRIEDDLVTLSLDSSGAPLHKRGHKEAVGKAPLRESMAAMFLHQCGFTGAESVVDPMCGSGTIPIEAAEIAAGLHPGRSRSFAFEHLASFDAKAFAKLKEAEPSVPQARFYGYDRDDGAIRMSTQNAERAGVAGWASFTRQAVSDLTPPPGPPGLVLVNPPYGARIGNKGLLYGLYGALGDTLKTRFSGWRVGLVTTDQGLVKATGLPFRAPGPFVAHGGLKIRLWQAGPLP